MLRVICANCNTYIWRWLPKQPPQKYETIRAKDFAPGAHEVPISEAPCCPVCGQSPFLQGANGPQLLTDKGVYP